MGVRLNKAKSTDGNGLLTHFKGLDKSHSSITVGIQANAQNYANGTSILDVAVSGEFGNARANVKPRRFLSLSVLRDKSFYVSRIKKILKKYTKGNSKFLKTSMVELGRQSTKKVQSNIENNTIGMLANTENTAQAKGGNQPMVDTGHLVRQISYKLEKSFL